MGCKWPQHRDEERSRERGRKRAKGRGSRRRRIESETREKNRGGRKGKVIKARGEGERLETPLNKSELPSNLSVSRLFLLVTEDQLVLVTGVLLCAIGWLSGQCVHECVCMSGRIPSITHGLGPQAETRSHVGDGGRRAEEEQHPRPLCALALVCVSAWKGEQASERARERQR